MPRTPLSLKDEAKSSAPPPIQLPKPTKPLALASASSESVPVAARALPVSPPPAPPAAAMPIQSRRVTPCIHRSFLSLRACALALPFNPGPLNAPCTENTRTGPTRGIGRNDEAFSGAALAHYWIDHAGCHGQLPVARDPSGRSTHGDDQPAYHHGAIWLDHRRLPGLHHVAAGGGLHHRRAGREDRLCLVCFCLVGDLHGARLRQQLADTGGAAWSSGFYRRCFFTRRSESRVGMVSGQGARAGWRPL